MKVFKKDGTLTKQARAITDSVRRSALFFDFGERLIPLFAKTEQDADDIIAIMDAFGVHCHFSRFESGWRICVHGMDVIEKIPAS